MNKILFLMLAVLSALPLAAAPMAFSVNVNLTSLTPGTTVFLDFQFNPGMVGSTDSASSFISGFNTDGTLAASSEPAIGAVTGSLPATVQIDNTDAAGYNDYAHQVTVGTFLGFTVTLSGPGVEAPTGQPYGSLFTFSILDPITFAPIFPVTSPDGFLLTVDVPETGGVAMPVGWAIDERVLSVTEPSEVPEPASFLLVGAGLGAAALLARRRRSDR